MSDKENHYEGLMASMRHARNRLLFFLIFAAYNFLAILGTTDTMLFLESGVTMPFLNIQLPLLAFYAVMPLFLLILYFHLLYTFRSYRRFLLDSQAERDDALKYLPIGLYEGALLHQDGFHRGVRFAMRFLLYFLPLLVFAAFWFRFADYQSPVLSLWHLILLVIASLLGLHFRGLLKQIEPQRSRIFASVFRRHNWLHQYPILINNVSQLNSGSALYTAFSQLIHAVINIIKKYAALLVISLALLFFLGSIFTYHFNVIYPLSRKNIDLSKLRKLEILEENIDAQLKSFLNRDQWFLPRIVIQGEVLVDLNKEQLEILQNLNNAYLEKQAPKNTTLLLAASPQNQSQRNFRLIKLENCTLTRINFNNTQLQGADLREAQLQGADLREAQLQGADLREAQLQGADLSDAQLQGANLWKAQLQGAYLDSAQLQGADLSDAQLQGADLSDAQLQGAGLSSAQLQGAYLIFAQLQGADLSYAQLQGASLRHAQLQGADLSDAQLQGASLIFAKLQGAYLSDAQLQGASLRYAQLQGAFLGKSQLQGAGLKEAQLQGADLSYAQLQGVYTSLDISFNQTKLKTANLDKIDQSILSKQQSEQIIELISSHINIEDERDKARLDNTIKRLQDAVGKDPIAWVKNQPNINLGILTEQEFNKIANSITEPTVRKRMGLTPLEDL